MAPPKGVSYAITRTCPASPWGRDHPLLYWTLLSANLREVSEGRRVQILTLAFCVSRSAFGPFVLYSQGCRVHEVLASPRRAEALRPQEKQWQK